MRGLVGEEDSAPPEDDSLPLLGVPGYPHLAQGPVWGVWLGRYMGEGSLGLEDDETESLERSSLAVGGPGDVGARGRPDESRREGEVRAMEGRAMEARGSSSHSSSGGGALLPDPCLVHRLGFFLLFRRLSAHQTGDRRSEVNSLSVKESKIKDSTHMLGRQRSACSQLSAQARPERFCKRILLSIEMIF